MSRGLNKVMIIGNLGHNPEMRYTPSGRPVTSFDVASTRSWTADNGEKKSETEWFSVVAWGSLAETTAQYLTKGQQVYVEGRLQSRKWEDQEGKKRTTVEIVANEVMMLGDRKDSADSLPDVNPGESREEEFPF